MPEISETFFDNSFEIHLKIIQNFLNFSKTSLLFIIFQNYSKSVVIPQLLQFLQNFFKFPPQFFSRIVPKFLWYDFFQKFFVNSFIFFLQFTLNSSKNYLENFNKISSKMFQKLLRNVSYFLNSFKKFFYTKGDS